MRLKSYSSIMVFRKLVTTLAIMASVVTMFIYWVPWNNAKHKKILFWNSYFDYPNFNMGEGSGQELFINAKCPINTCFGTSSRKLFPVENYDAIVFHTMNIDTHDLPLERNPSQRYVFFLLESPRVSRNNMKLFPNFFNWTMTYRRDSDIPNPYGMITPIDSSEYAPLNQHPDWLKPDERFEDSRKMEIIAKKTKLIAWFVSNCKTPSKREDYVKELSKYITVDIYGKCGDKSCSKSDEHKCREMLSANYKFYLSMENSLCKDYVTEKLFRTMKYDVVPVVYGAANYSNHAPPMSYINAFDFGSARELADYLVYLDQNHEEYIKYFWWKQHYKIKPNAYGRDPMCKLCEMLHQDLIPKSYSDIYEWWRGSGVCIKASDLNILD